MTAHRTDRWSCPWTTAGWKVFTIATAGAALVVIAAGAVTAALAGTTAAVVVVAAAGGLAAVVAMVIGAVVAEDRAGAEPVALTAAWRSARKARRRLAKLGRRVPEGPLRRLVQDEVAAIDRQLRVDQHELEALWLDRRETSRFGREARRGGPSVESSAEPLRGARQDDEARRAAFLTARLEALTAATDRLRDAVAERVALDRVTMALPAAPAPPAESAGTALPAPHPDAIAAALEELAELDRATLASLGASER